MRGAYAGSSAFQYENAAGDTGTSMTGSVLDHEIPAGELSAVVGVERGRVRFASEARAAFVDEAFDGAYEDRVAGYRYMNAVTSARQRDHGYVRLAAVSMPTASAAI